MSPCWRHLAKRLQPLLYSVLSAHSKRVILSMRTSSLRTCKVCKYFSHYNSHTINLCQGIGLASLSVVSCTSNPAKKFDIHMLARMDVHASTTLRIRTRGR